MDSVRLTAGIRSEAARIGFAKIGFAPAGIPPHMSYFRKWLRSGFNGEMRWLERQVEKRGNPELVLPNVKSVVVVALSYYSGVYPQGSNLTGRVSRYALGEDYHSAVMERLEHLLRFTRTEIPKANGRCYVDTGPVMEKIWGAQTSVGWTGKHSVLAARDLGTRFFTGVILLDIPLEYDEKSDAFCGNCRRCLDACPTGALVEPYQLDVRKCLSYLTIEFRGHIPREIRPLVGNRIFGCDECLDACPWNRFAVKTTIDELVPRVENLAPQLLSLAGLSREEFEQRFAASPVLRATRDGFTRNVMIALGNSRCVEAVPALTSALADESLLVREHAKWAISIIGTSKYIAGKATQKREKRNVLG